MPRGNFPAMFTFNSAENKRMDRFLIALASVPDAVFVSVSYFDYVIVLILVYHVGMLRLQLLLEFYHNSLHFP